MTAPSNEPDNLRIACLGNIVKTINPPHPEEARSAVSKDGAASSFETRSFGALLRMRPSEAAA